MYHFKFADKCLQVTPSLDGRKILSSLVKNTEPTMTPNSIFRTREFDNQGSSRPWTWAWTTDKNPFEIWRPGGLYLKMGRELASKLKIPFDETIFL